MTTALSVRDATKIFGGQTALDHVSIDVQPGEVRALVGQNGCGKSTLIKILAGFHEPEPGTSVTVGGTELEFSSATASEAAGLRFVHQDLGLVANLDAVDNMAIGQGYITNMTKTISWRKERNAAREALKELGYDINVRVPVGALQMSERTAVAIARAMSTRGSETKMLILDEPTANLPGAEAQRLYKLVRGVADRGIAVLFVSHHFDEVFEMADSVTVLRDAKHIITRPVFEALFDTYSFTTNNPVSSSMQKIVELLDAHGRGDRTQVLELGDGLQGLKQGTQRETHRLRSLTACSHSADLCQYSEAPRPPWPSTDPPMPQGRQESRTRQLKLTPLAQS